MVDSRRRWSEIWIGGERMCNGGGGDWREKQTETIHGVREDRVVEAKIPLKLFLNDKQTLVLKLRL